MYWRDALPTLLSDLTAKPRLGLITDVDGTISPIVDEPDQARVTPRCRAGLKSLQDLLPLVAVVSGRAAADVRQRVDLPGLVYVGNHGLEQWRDGQVIPAPEVDRYRPALQSAISNLQSHLLPGMVIEDKTATLSIHYRQAASPQSAADRFRPIVETVANQAGLRVFEGRMIFELRPPIEINKGTAFHHLVNTYQLDSAIYMGDDTTGVDALQMAQQLRKTGACYAVGIGVQSPDMPDAVGEAADVMVSGVSEVEDFLDWLVSICNASST